MSDGMMHISGKIFHFDAEHHRGPTLRARMEWPSVGL